MNAFRRPRASRPAFVLPLLLIVLPAVAARAEAAPAPPSEPAAKVAAPVSPAAAQAYALGRMLELEGSLPQALEQLRTAAAAAPRDAYVQLELATVEARIGRGDDALRAAREALRLAPDDPDVLGEGAEVLAALGEEEPGVLTEAQRALEHLVELRPEQPGALQMLGRLYLAQGDTGKAEAMFRRLVAVVPDSPQASNQLLRLLVQQGKKSDAVALLRDQLERDQDSVETRLALADLLADGGDHKGAVSVLKAATGDAAASPELQRRLAFELYRSGDTPGASALVDRLLAQGNDPRLRLFRALLLEDQGKGEAALHELETLHRDAPDDPEIGLSLARLLARGERREEAVALLQSLGDKLAGDSSHPDVANRVRLELAQLLGEDGRWEDVLQQLDLVRFDSTAAERGAPGNDDLRAPALLLRVDALVALGRKEQALALLVPDGGLSAQTLAAKRAEVLLGLGRDADAAAELAKVGTDAEGKARVAEVYQRAGQHARAIPILRELLAADPAADDVRFRLGTAYERAGEREQAVATFQDLLKRQPNSAMTLNYLGYMWAEKGEKLDDALELVQRALAIDPGNPAYLDSLGWVYFQMKQYPRAVEELQKAARLMPADSTVQEHLGDALRAAGKLADARVAYQRALAAAKDNAPAVKKKLDEIERSGVAH